MSDKPSRRGWLKGLATALFGGWAAETVTGQESGEAPPPAPKPPLSVSTDALSRVTTYTYDSGTPISTRGAVVTYYYDGRGRVVGRDEQPPLA